MLRPDTRSTHGTKENIIALSGSIHLLASLQDTLAALTSTRHISALRAGISWQVRLRSSLHLRQQRRASTRWLKRCWRASGATVLIVRIDSQRLDMITIRYRQQSTSSSRLHRCQRTRSSMQLLMKSS